MQVCFVLLGPAVLRARLDQPTHNDELYKQVNEPRQHRAR